jgi:prevent-host-death family protein
MKSASVAEVKTHFSSYLKDSENGPVVVTRNGRPIAMLVAVTDEDEVERLMMAESPQLQEILDAARQRIQNGGGIPAKEFWAKREQGKGAKSNGKRRAKKT